MRHRTQRFTTRPPSAVRRRRWPAPHAARGGPGEVSAARLANPVGAGAAGATGGRDLDVAGRAVRRHLRQWLPRGDRTRRQEPVQVAVVRVPDDSACFVAERRAPRGRDGRGARGRAPRPMRSRQAPGDSRGRRAAPRGCLLLCRARGVLSCEICPQSAGVVGEPGLPGQCGHNAAAWLVDKPDEGTASAVRGDPRSDAGGGKGHFDGVRFSRQDGGEKLVGNGRGVDSGGAVACPAAYRRGGRWYRLERPAPRMPGFRHIPPPRSATNRVQIVCFCTQNRGVKRSGRICEYRFQ